MKLVHGALKFDDIVIRSVMTPRTKMFTLNSKMLLFEALPQINQSGHSRIPIYGDTKRILLDSFMQEIFLKN